MSVTGAARGTSQRRLFYRCGASIYRGRGRLGAVRSVCRTAGLGVGRAIVCSHPGRVLLHGGVARSIVGAPPRCEAKSDQYTEPAHSHPGRVLLQGGGDALDCRSTASVRSEVKPIHRACPIRTRGGCSYRVGGTRSIVGAPPRCDPSQTNTPSPPCSHPGRVLLPVLRGNEKASASFDARAFDMAQRTGLEPATPGVTGRYSNRLNYRCASV